MSSVAERLMAEPPDTLSAEELELVRRAVASGRLGPVPRPRIRHPEPLPSTPEDLARYEPEPRPAERAPATYEEQLQQEHQLRLWEKRDLARHRDWCSLTAQVKTQLVSDRRWADPSEPYWRVSVEAVGDNTPESGLPPQLVRAPTAEVAAERFGSLMGLVGGTAGLLNDGQHRQELRVTAYEAPAPAPDG
jgi:hypothetical protein